MNTWVDLRNQDPDAIEALYRGIVDEPASSQREVPRRGSARKWAYSSIASGRRRRLELISGVLIAALITGMIWKIVLYQSHTSASNAVAVGRANGVEASANRVFSAPEPHEEQQLEAGFRALWSGAVPRSLLREARGATLLWVDDHPENNVNEARVLRDQGINVVVVRSNIEAFERVRRRYPELIVSDMRREKDLVAGYVLLESLRQAGIAVSVIIYSDNCSPERRAEAKRLGAFACAYLPSELFRYIGVALSANAP